MRHRYEAGGWHFALTEAPRSGTPPRFDGPQRAALTALACTPALVGHSRWTLRLLVSGYYEYQADFGWVNTLDNNRRFAKEVVWRAGAEYLLSRNLSLMGSYENRFGGGGGLNLRF